MAWNLRIKERLYSLCNCFVILFISYHPPRITHTWCQMKQAAELNWAKSWKHWGALLLTAGGQKHWPVSFTHHACNAMFRIHYSVAGTLCSSHYMTWFLLIGAFAVFFSSNVQFKLYGWPATGRHTLHDHTLHQETPPMLSPCYSGSYINIFEIWAVHCPSTHSVPHTHISWFGSRKKNTLLLIINEMYRIN